MQGQPFSMVPSDAGYRASIARLEYGSTTRRGGSWGSARERARERFSRGGCSWAELAERPDEAERGGSSVCSRQPHASRPLERIARIDLPVPRSRLYRTCKVSGFMRTRDPGC